MTDSANKTHDRIYATPHAEVADFSFDERVAQVFPDMINRSVPGYATMVHGIGRLTARYAQSGTVLYDLGCSLGAATLAMKQNNSAENCLIVGLDSSKAMVERCQTHVNAFRGNTPVEIRLADILTADYEPCSVVVLNFTLQFIDPDMRYALLERLYQALVPGGILILSEKIRADDATNDALLIDLHHEFKRDNGYSELEISQKRAAIENVMRLNTLPEHIERLQAIGFSHIDNWYRCYNFTSMFAIKGHN
ncbi:carboxy-S-adenosyl-L-methionine synthase CmoA [Aliidiomarina maris]|uniref:Carboxy-S-adenosyl-L-methionine synthase n=1 Tax=Aliidiomarina maris TaxID=531312 RepID=A0A327X307_9GAMM|nr:carboxy-S-adenosyl-L-methionine synthase CmoA [Aliidiomarina maris]MCL5049638.1 carboxy-S-adenosyl-L-methionine synthase CmoA [Bacillota bacterium]RAK00788.1 tRNA (cmo5U34)-methyltransferase [Aliidiomarina maris]RUO27217.1 carboxy-S-adenosyl-L-methionine synthase CmoA [Aliidiomarina maris]